jgi:hypothetical protein
VWLLSFEVNFASVSAQKKQKKKPKKNTVATSLFLLAKLFFKNAKFGPEIHFCVTKIHPFEQIFINLE